LGGDRDCPQWKVRVSSIGTTGYHFWDLDPKSAAKVAEYAQVTPLLRKRPSSQVSVRFFTDKTEYAPGEPIELHIEMKNEGRNAVIIGTDARAGLSRCAALEIWPREGQNPPATDLRAGSSKSFARLAMSLGPGKTWKAPIEPFGKWYGTKERGISRFEAIYRLGYYDKTAYEDKKGDARAV
jgi:hypothetical protein